MSRKHGWHFARDDFKLCYGDNRLIESGATFTVDCKPILCQQGLHDSIRAIDALHYAPGPVVSRTVLSGKVIEDEDKRVGTKRTHLWCYDASEELKAFARWCALEVIDLWDAPEVVREYFEIGDESLRVAAYNAARDAIRATSVARVTRVACYAALYAASNAISDVAWYASWNSYRITKMRDKQNEKLEQLLLDGWKNRNNI